MVWSIDQDDLHGEWTGEFYPLLNYIKDQLQGKKFVALFLEGTFISSILFLNHGKVLNLEIFFRR